MSQIEPGHVETELEGMTPTVRNAFLRNLRAVFNFGIQRGWLEKNPIAKLDFQGSDAERGCDAVAKRGTVVDAGR